MAQGKAVYSSFPRDGACSGLELPNPAYVDSVDRYTPEQYPTSYHAMRSTIIEAAQASGELQPLTEAEMERRAANEEAARQLFEAEVQREEREIEGRLADQSLDEKEREKLDARLDKLRAIEKKGPTYGFLYDPAGNMVALKHYEFDSMDLADWRVVCCDVGGEPYEARVIDAYQYTTETHEKLAEMGILPAAADARIVVTTEAEQGGEAVYHIDCYGDESRIVTGKILSPHAANSEPTVYLNEWGSKDAAQAGASKNQYDPARHDDKDTLVRAA